MLTFSSIVVLPSVKIVWYTPIQSGVAIVQHNTTILLLRSRAQSRVRFWVSAVSILENTGHDIMVPSDMYNGNVRNWINNQLINNHGNRDLNCTQAFWKLSVFSVYLIMHSMECQSGKNNSRRKNHTKTIVLNQGIIFFHITEIQFDHFISNWLQLNATTPQWLFVTLV